MAHFYGKLWQIGQEGTTKTRTGTKKRGIAVEVCGASYALTMVIYHDETTGTDMVRVSRTNTERGTSSEPLFAAPIETFPWPAQRPSDHAMLLDEAAGVGDRICAVLGLTK